MRRFVAICLLALSLSLSVVAGEIPQPAPCTGENCPPSSAPISEPVATNDEEDTSPTTTLLLDLITLALDAAL